MHVFLLKNLLYLLIVMRLLLLDVVCMSVDVLLRWLFNKLSNRYNKDILKPKLAVFSHLNLHCFGKFGGHKFCVFLIKTLQQSLHNGGCVG